MSSWIKICHETPNKPEVLKISKILGVSKYEVFTKLFLLWCWFDVNSIDGQVSGLSNADIDDLVTLPGLFSALHDVGWIKKSDSDQDLFVIPNFNRHNGETAKKRALSAQRQVKFKNSNDESNAKVTQKVTLSALPDKIREEKIRTEEIRTEKEKEKEKEKNIVDDSEKTDSSTRIDFCFFRNAWNKLQEQYPQLAKVSLVTEKRKRWIKTRLGSDKDFQVHFIACLELIPNRPFLLGLTGGAWVIDFDYLIKNDTNYVSIIDGKFRDSKQIAQTQNWDNIFSKRGKNEADN